MTKTELLSVVKIQYPCDSFVSEAIRAWCSQKFEENIFTPLRTACRPRRTKRFFGVLFAGVRNTLFMEELHYEN